MFWSRGGFHGGAGQAMGTPVQSGEERRRDPRTEEDAGVGQGPRRGWEAGTGLELGATEKAEAGPHARPGEPTRPTAGCRQEGAPPPEAPGQGSKAWKQSHITALGPAARRVPSLSGSCLRSCSCWTLRTGRAPPRAAHWPGRSPRLPSTCSCPRRLALPTREGWSRGHSAHKVPGQHCWSHPSCSFSPGAWGRAPTAPTPGAVWAGRLPHTEDEVRAGQCRRNFPDKHCSRREGRELGATLTGPGAGLSSASHQVGFPPGVRFWEPPRTVLRQCAGGQGAWLRPELGQACGWAQDSVPHGRARESLRTQAGRSSLPKGAAQDCILDRRTHTVTHMHVYTAARVHTWEQSAHTPRLQPTIGQPTLGSSCCLAPPLGGQPAAS